MSDKLIYKPIYGVNKLHAQQYIVELIIQHGAKQSKITLPKQFWKDPKWKSWGKRIVSENIHASKLVNNFDTKAIILAIKDHRCKFVKSLKNKTLVEVIQEYQNHIDIQNEIKELEIKEKIIDTTTALPPKRGGKISRKNRLK